MRAVVIAMLALAVGCDTRSGGAGDLGSGADLAAPAASGNATVAACMNIDGIPEPCAWRWQVDAARCTPAQPCSKLVLFFAGGEQDCSTYDGILNSFTGAGYLATCIQLFTSAGASGCEPYLAEAPRVDAVVRDILGSSVMRALWDGRDLLWSGISHGATAPVIAMARTTLDDAVEWHGARTTGACFFDGAYDIDAFDKLLGTGAAGGGPCVTPVSHQRIVGRYQDAYPTCGQGPASHSCTNGQCGCAPGHPAALDMDTIVAEPASAFAIQQWKLIECGSALPACSGDIIPGPPIQALCTTLATAPHACVFDSMPNVSHLQCAPVGIGRCTAWFDALIP